MSETSSQTSVDDDRDMLQLVSGVCTSIWAISGVKARTRDAQASSCESPVLTRSRAGSSNGYTNSAVNPEGSRLDWTDALKALHDFSMSSLSACTSAPE